MGLKGSAAVLLTGAVLVSSASARAQEAIPDFSGVLWSHPSFPGFEPPASGPGPVVNTVRRPQIVDADGRPLPVTNNILVSAFARRLWAITAIPS